MRHLFGQFVRSGIIFRHAGRKRLPSLILAVAALVLLYSSPAAAGAEVKIVYFYISACDGCNEAGKILEELNTLLDSYPDRPETEIIMVNAFQSGGYEQLNRYLEAYEVPEDKQSCPIVFVGDTFLSGEEAIRKDLIGAILNAKDEIPVSASYGGEAAQEKLSLLTPVNVFLTGLVNGLNPCSMSMLLFLISLLAVRKVNVLKAGSAFCAGKLASYFFLGMVSYGLLDRLDTDRYRLAVKLIILAAALLIAAFNIRDYIAARQERYDKVKMQLPKGLRKINHRLMKSLTAIKNVKLLLGICFLLGIFISFGEFLCTGQLYLAAILYVLKEGTALRGTAFLYFFIYSAAMLIPLLIISFAIHKGKEVFTVSEAIRGRLPLIKLINAAAFILFGIFAVIFL